MEALNAIASNPISVLSDRRTEPRKISSLPSIFPLKFPNSPNFITNPPNFTEGLSRNFSVHGGLVLLSSVLNTGLARALTYEEALGQSVSASNVDETGIFDSVISFGSENPAILAGGALVLAVPLIVSQLLKSPKSYGVESAKAAYGKLGEDPSVQLLDIRALKEVKEVGSPDIRGFKKKPVSIVYRGEDKPGFLKKLSLKFKEPENITLVILDKFDGNSELVAELVTVNGFKAAYAIKDGAEGPRGWLNSNLPWIQPKKAFSFDFGDITDAISGVIGEGFDAVPLALGIATAAGLGLLAFTEVETILEVLGSVALVQFVSKKLLFAEDRKGTLQEVDEFVTTKIAPKDLVDEIKQIGIALLPLSVTTKALRSPVEASSPKAEAVPELAPVEASSPKAEAVPELAPVEAVPQKAEAVPELKPEPIVEAAQPTPEINSIPKTEVKAESLSEHKSFLSPYPFYPDFKPPTSPSPSKP